MIATSSATGDTVAAGKGLATDLVSMSAELVSLSAALARAVESGDLDEAERLIGARGHLINRASSATRREPGADRVALTDAAARMAAADGRTHRGLLGRIAGLKDELAGLVTGVSALRAYSAPDALAPGFVDRRD